jgi:hypothetical protein
LAPLTAALSTVGALNSAEAPSIESNGMSAAPPSLVPTAPPLPEPSALGNPPPPPVSATLPGLRQLPVAEPACLTHEYPFGQLLDDVQTIWETLSSGWLKHPTSQVVASANTATTRARPRTLDFADIKRLH